MIDFDQDLIRAQTSKDTVNVELSHTTEDQIDYVKVGIKAEEEIYYPKVELKWKHPIIDIQSAWHPGSLRDKGLDPDWKAGFSAKATSLAPVMSFYNADNRNRLSIAYSKVLEPVKFKMGVEEETGELDCRIELFNQSRKKRKNYQAEIRIDKRDVPYYQAVKDISDWYQNKSEYTSAPVPQEAKSPVYSTWYGFHQELSAREITKQCKKAKEIGFDSVIVDDGWQTADNNRGYGYCGDWEVSMEKMSNMKEHVDRINDLEMKYLLWYSVPFVGVHSKAWSDFKDKLLFYDEDREAGVMDPRYPEVREYLINTYKEAVKNWDLDGLKLDFIDQFDLENAEDKALKEDDERDFSSVQQAVDKLLSDTMQAAKNVKKDLMIELRQNYIGPVMGKYGNMFRVKDCPSNAINNRVGTIDLRLLSGDTAVHSDMIMWNTEDTVESASLQLINALFSVPQFSMKFDELPEEQLEMVKSWIDFWKENKDVLLEGQLKPKFPELMYPLVESESLDKKLVTTYCNDLVINVENNIPQVLIVVNGTLSDNIKLHFREEISERKLKTYDCRGNLVEEKSVSYEPGVYELDAEPSGYLKLLS